MPRHRGIVSRAASALLFCLAAGAALVFPDGRQSASALQSLPAAAFRPAQVPAPEIFQDPEYNPADLCADLGGQSESAEGVPNSVCSDLDFNDTFCFVHSAEALPCLGLFRHVITCNRRHNRPALDPFHCAQTCGDEKARGARCEKVAEADQVLAVRATVIFAAEGFVGAGHTLTVGENWTLTFRPRDNPAGRVGFDLVEISGGDDWEIRITSAVAKQTLTVAAVARIRRDDYYPDALSVSVDFAPVLRPVQAAVAPVQTQTPLAGIVLAKPVAPHDGGRFEISEVLLDGSPRDDHQFTLNADSGEVSGQVPFPGTFLLRADYFADGANPFLGPMRISITVVAEGAGKAPLQTGAVLANRAPTILIAENFARAGAEIFTVAPDDPRYTLAFADPAEADSAELDFDSQGGIFSFPAGATMTADRSAAVTAAVVGCPANIDCGGDPKLALTLFARVVLAPEQPTLRASRAAGFSHAIRLPSAPAGMDLALANPASPFVVFENNLTPASADAPRAGKYRATILATHGEMIGTLALAVPAEIWFADAALVEAHCAAAGGEADDATSGGETVGRACENIPALAVNCFGPGANYNSAIHLEVAGGGGESVSLCDDLLTECRPGQIDLDGNPFTNLVGGPDCYAPGELVTIFFRAVASGGGTGGVLVATDAGVTLQSGDVLPRPATPSPPRPIVFTATPTTGYFVSGWGGANSSNIVSGCRPGPANAASECRVNPFYDVDVAVTFAVKPEAVGATDFSGFRGVANVGDIATVSAGGADYQMFYAGVRRGVQGAYSAANFTGAADADRARLVCEAGGWRAPTLGEIVGWQAPDERDGPFEISSAGGGVPAQSPAGIQSPAGSAGGVRVVVRPDDDGDADFYINPAELDSRDASGRNVAVFYNAERNAVIVAARAVRRHILCVNPTAGYVSPPALAGARFETDGAIVDAAGHLEKSNQNPGLYTVTATLARGAQAGDAVATVTARAWKHKRRPEVHPVSLAVTRHSGDARLAWTAAAAASGNGTEIVARLASAPPAGAFALTLILDAHPPLGLAARLMLIAEAPARLARLNFTPDPDGGAVSVLVGGTGRNPGDMAEEGAALEILATPGPDRAGAYVYGWTGACAEPGAAEAITRTPGRALTCRLAMREGLQFGAVFGRDECLTNRGGCPSHEVCSDPLENQDEEGDARCAAELPVPDSQSIPPDRRVATAFVGGLYTGSVAYFRARHGEVTLRVSGEPSSALRYPLHGEFAGADGGFTVSLSRPLYSGGFALEESFVVTAKSAGRGYSDAEMTLAVRVSVAADSAYVGERAVSLTAGAVGALFTMTIQGFPNARFSSGNFGPLAVGEDGVITAALPLESGVYGVFARATHEDLRGHVIAEAELVVAAAPDLSCRRPPDAVLTDRAHQALHGALLDLLDDRAETRPVARACAAIRDGADPDGQLIRFARVNHPGASRVMKFLLEQAEADVNAFDFNPGTPLDSAVQVIAGENGGYFGPAPANAALLRPLGGACARQSRPECAADHPDYAGLPEVSAADVVAPADRVLDVALGFSQYETGALWEDHAWLAAVTVGAFAHRDDPARRVRLNPVHYGNNGPDNGLIRAESFFGGGNLIRFFGGYPGPGQTLRTNFDVQGGQNGRRPRIVRVSLILRALPYYERVVRATSLDGKFFNLRTLPGLENAEFVVDRESDGVEEATAGFFITLGMAHAPENFSGEARVPFRASADGIRGFVYGMLRVNPTGEAGLDPDLIFPDRAPVRHALPGYAGGLFTLEIYRAGQRGYRLNLFGATPDSFASGGLVHETHRNGRDEIFSIPEGDPMGTEVRRAALTMSVACRVCRPDETLTATLTIMPRQPPTIPAQMEVRATSGFYLRATVNLPPPYPDGDGWFLEVDPATPEFEYFDADKIGDGFYLRRRLDLNAPAGSRLAPSPAGVYTVALLLRDLHVFGTATVSMTVVNVGRSLEGLGIPRGEWAGPTVWVAPGFVGRAHGPLVPADPRVKSDCANAVVSGPDAADFRLNEDCEWLLVSGEGRRVAEAGVLETLDALHESRRASLTIQVVEIPTPLAEYNEAALYRSAAAHDFAAESYAGGIYAGAVFSRVGNSRLLLDSRGRVSTDGVLAEGSHGLTARAANPARFLGDAFLTVSLHVSAGPDHGVPDELLMAEVQAAAGHAGELHRLIATGRETVLRCPPAGNSEITLTAECVFVLLGGSGRRELAGEFTETLPDGATRARMATVAADEIPAPPESSERVFADSPPGRGEADFLDLAEIDSGGQAFGLKFPSARFALGADDSAVLAVSPRGRVRLREATAPGDYRATVFAFAPDLAFRGTVRFSVLVEARDQVAPVAAADSIPLAERTFQVYIQGGRARFVPGVGVTNYVWDGTSPLYLGTIWAATAAHPAVSLRVFNLQGRGARLGDGNAVVLPYSVDALLVRPGNIPDLRIFTFDVRAERPGFEWDAIEFPMEIRLRAFDPAAPPWVSSRNVAVPRADAAGRVLMTFAIPQFPGAEFEEVSDAGGRFTVASDGEVRLSGAVPPVGEYELVARAAEPSGRRFKRFLAADGGIPITAKIRLTSPEQVVFAGESLAVGERVGLDDLDVPLPSSEVLVEVRLSPTNFQDGQTEADPINATMLYHGRRRGLHWMVSETEYLTSSRGLPLRVCELGGKGWRLPGAAELAGAMRDGNGPLVLTENNRNRAIPGASAGLPLPFAAADGAAATLAHSRYFSAAADGHAGSANLAFAPLIVEGENVILGGGYSTVLANRGRVIIGQGQPGQNTLETVEGLPFAVRIACVLEASGSVAAPSPRILGARVEGLGKILAGGEGGPGVRGSASPPLHRAEIPGVFRVPGPVLTVTASAWRYFSRADQNFPLRAEARDVLGAPLTPALSSADGFALSHEAVGGRRAAVVRMTRLPEFEERARTFTLSFAPSLGATVSLLATVRAAAPPVSDAEAERALPAAARVVVRKSAVGYSGPILTVTAHDPAFRADVSAGAIPDGFGLSRAGGDAALTVSMVGAAARRVGFPVSISVVGRNSRRAVSVFVSLLPLAQARRAVELPANEAAGATLAALGREADFSGGVFEKISGAAGLAADAQSGEVTAADRPWVPGVYAIVVGARNPAVFLGRVLLTVELRVVDSTAPILFHFGDTAVRGVAETLVADAAGGAFTLTYRGLRRGLHWLESSALSADGARQVPLCLAGWRVLDFRWRTPGAAEVAGLLLDGGGGDIGGADPSGGGAAENVSLPLAPVDAAETLFGISAGPFFADFRLGENPVRVRAAGGELRLADSGAARHLCALPARDDYRPPPALVGVRAEAEFSTLVTLTDEFGRSRFAALVVTTTVNNRVMIDVFESPVLGISTTLEARLGGGGYEFGHGQRKNGEVFRLSIFAYNSPLAGRRDNPAASLRAEVVRPGPYEVRFESGPDSPGSGALVVESFGVPAAGTYEIEARLTPDPGPGAAAVFSLTGVVAPEPIPVLAADSIPPGERRLGMEVHPDYRGFVWSANPLDPAVMLTLIPGPDGEIFANQNEGSVRDVNDFIGYDRAQNAVRLRGDFGAGADFEFRVRATRAGAEWLPDEFRIDMRLFPLASRPLRRASWARDAAAGRVLMTFALPEFPGAEFSETADAGGLFAVGQNGEVRLSGGSAPPAGEYELAVRADEPAGRRTPRFLSANGIPLTAKILFVSAPEVAFAGRILSEGASVNVTVADDLGRTFYFVFNDPDPDSSAPDSTKVFHARDAVYRGIRAGLHWVESANPLGRREWFGGFQQGTARRFCEKGGAADGRRWRLPTLGELAGILSDAPDGTGGAGGTVLLDENNRVRQIPGAAPGLEIAAVARGGAKNLTGDAFISDVVESSRGGRVVPVVYNAAGGRTRLGGDLPAGPDPRMACVLETDSAVPQPPLQGALVEVDGAVSAGGEFLGAGGVGRGPEFPETVEAEHSRPLTFRGAAVTIRAAAWRYRAGAAGRLAVFSPDAAAAALGRLEVSAPPGFLVERSDSPRGGRRAILRVDYAPGEFEIVQATVAARPRLGAAVSLILDLVVSSPESLSPPIPATLQAALLPVSLRTPLIRAVSGYAPPLHRIVSGAPEFGEVRFSPSSSGGLSLAADGNIFANPPLGGAADARGAAFPVTLSVPGHRRAFLDVAVSVVPVAFERFSAAFPSDRTGGVLLDLRRAHPLLGRAVFNRIFGDDSSPLLELNQDGELRSAEPAGLPVPAEGDPPYQVFARAASPDFLGEAPVEATIRVEPPPLREGDLEKIIPSARRDIRRVAAPGYAGAVYTITAFAAGATLRFADAATVFAVDSAGRVSLAAGVFTGGSDAAESVRMTVVADGFSPTPLEVSVAVSPPRGVLTLFAGTFNPGVSGDIYDFGSGNLAGAVFTRDGSSSAELTLSGAGVLGAPGSLAEGEYQLSGAAGGGAVLGTVPVRASVGVAPPDPIRFGGVEVTVSGDRAAADACEALSGFTRGFCDNYATLTYHGRRRGLHWMVSERTNHSGNDWQFSWHICESGGTHGGAQWRLPTLGEIAGGVADDSESFLTLGTVFFARLTPGAAAGVRLDFPRLRAGDAGPLPPVDIDNDPGFRSPGTARERGLENARIYFSLLRESGVSAGGGRSPMLYRKSDGETGINSANSAFVPTDEHYQSSRWLRGRMACVLEARGYSPRPNLLGIRVKSGGKTLFGEWDARSLNQSQREARVAAPAVSAAGAVFTLTATGWRHRLLPVDIVRGIGAIIDGKFVVDRSVEPWEDAGARLEMGLFGDSSGASFSRRTAAGSGEEVILSVEEVPAGVRELELRIWPELGLTARIFITLRAEVSGGLGGSRGFDFEVSETGLEAAAFTPAGRFLDTMSSAPFRDGGGRNAPECRMSNRSESRPATPSAKIKSPTAIPLPPSLPPPPPLSLPPPSSFLKNLPGRISILRPGHRFRGAAFACARAAEARRQSAPSAG